MPKTESRQRGWRTIFAKPDQSGYMRDLERGPISSKFSERAKRRTPRGMIDSEGGGPNGPECDAPRYPGKKNGPRLGKFNVATGGTGEVRRLKKYVEKLQSLKLRGFAAQKYV